MAEAYKVLAVELGSDHFENYLLGMFLSVLDDPAHSVRETGI